MGWQGFPDEVTITKARAEMLDEGIDILTLLYYRKPFDYDGKLRHARVSPSGRIPLREPGLGHGDTHRLLDHRHLLLGRDHEPSVEGDPNWGVAGWGSRKLTEAFQ